MLEQAVIAYQFVEKGRELARRLKDVRLEKALQTLVDSHVALTDRLSPRQRQVVEAVVNSGEIRTGKCMTLLGLSRTHTVRLLQELESLHLLQKVGKGRGTRYILPLTAR